MWVQGEDKMRACVVTVKMDVFLAVHFVGVTINQLFNVARCCFLGLIPKRQDYFGCSYAETCRKALSESYHKERLRIQQQSAELTIIANDTNRQFEVNVQALSLSLYCPRTHTHMLTWHL